MTCGQCRHYSGNSCFSVEAALSLLDDVFATSKACEHFAAAELPVPVIPVQHNQEVTMIEKLMQAFANSDWNTVDLILLPRDEAEAEALLEHIPEEQQRRWEQYLMSSARKMIVAYVGGKEG